MWERRRIKSCFIVAAVIVLLTIVYFAYFCPWNVCSLLSRTDLAGAPSFSKNIDTHLDGARPRLTFQDEDLHKSHPFQMEGNDVLVFLHIQKTGGSTFGKHLTKNIELDIPCKCRKGRKRCDCKNSKRHMWLFSRYSTGWRCGLHADWTELKGCVADYLNNKEGYRERRYLYVTMVRDPIDRYLSEWKHVERGATWKNAQLKCNGRQATLQEVPFCYSGDDWSDVSLDEFIACPHNLANNRQTRMLANLSLVGCYNKSVMHEEDRNKIMLQSAKQNLQDMAFFGLLEFQRYSQYLFERTFQLGFIEKFIQFNITHSSRTQISQEQRNKINEKNKLDIGLYQFARELFLQRLRNALLEDPRVSEQVKKRDLDDASSLLLNDLLDSLDFDSLTSGTEDGKLHKQLQRYIKKKLKEDKN